MSDLGEYIDRRDMQSYVGKVVLCRDIPSGCWFPQWLFAVDKDSPRAYIGASTLQEGCFKQRWTYCRPIDISEI